jgi:uncharacterized protein (DUF2062 family)
MAGSVLVGWLVLNLVSAWPPVAVLAVVGVVVLAVHLALARWLMASAVHDLLSEARSRLSRRDAAR